jgi:HSP20 family molecular chaperone IbpA
MNAFDNHHHAGDGFDDLRDLTSMWLNPFGSTAMAPRPQTPQVWHVNVKLPGFHKDQVKIETDKERTKVKVDAERKTGDDEFKIKRTVDVPDNVDRNALQWDFIKPGVLQIWAPFITQPRPYTRDLFPYHVWGDLNKDMMDFKHEMDRLMHTTMPGTGDMRSEMVKDKDGKDNKLRVLMDLQGYKPEEITITQQGANGIEIEANHETRDHVEGEHVRHHVKKHFKRLIHLPKNVDVPKMTSKLLPDGSLCLEAPCMLAIEDSKKKPSGNPTDLEIKRK